MLDYAELAPILRDLSRPLNEVVATSRLTPILVKAWISDYSRSAAKRDIVQTADQGFSYLFDALSARLIAAWGLSKGKDLSPRTIVASRMKGHPLTSEVDGNRYHRGHAVPHTMGGRTDINLVPQLGFINSGPFQELERLAVATPGSLYFTYWSYPVSDTQRPSGVEQGCLIAGAAPVIRNFQN